MVRIDLIDLQRFELKVFSNKVKNHEQYVGINIINTLEQWELLQKPNPIEATGV